MLGRINLKSNIVLPAFVAGVVIAVIDLFIEISMAALLFSGPLITYLSNGIGLLLFGGLIMNIVVSLTSPTRGMIAFPQESTVVILAVITSSMLVSMPSAAPETTFATLVLIIIISSVLTGLVFLILSRLKLSRLVRFIPYPVIGGFLAGTGWLIVQGGFSVLTGHSLTLNNLSALFESNMITLWLPALLIAMILLFASRKINHPLLIPIFLLSVTALFFIWFMVSGVSTSELESRGMLLGSHTTDITWRVYLVSAFREANWNMIMSQSLQIGAILIVSVLAMLFNTSGIESTFKDDINLNHEMQAAGFANLLAGFSGSPVGFQALSYTVLGRQMSPPTRLIGLFAALCFGLFLLLGTILLSYLPVMVIGGVLLYLGLSFLTDWVYDAWFTLPATDYASVILILVVIGTLGFIEGVAAGIGIALVLFVYNYSRIDIIKHTFSGANYRSTVDRPPAQREYLRKNGDQILILQLQGYIFFGTAYQLTRIVKRRAASSNLQALRLAVLDFHLVDGLDASAASSFVRLKQHLDNENIQLVCSSMLPGIQAALVKAGLESGADKGPQIVSSLDDGVEYCENLLLESAGLAPVDLDHRLDDQLERIFNQPAQIQILYRYLEKLDIDKGDYIIHQGSRAESIYFVDSGLLSIMLELEGGRQTRVGTIQSGSVVGEIGFYLENERTASVIAAQPCLVYRLTLDAFRSMQRDHPEIAAALHEWIANILAERLSDNVNTLRTILD